MDFGKLPNLQQLDQIQFRLPPLEERSQKHLDQFSQGAIRKELVSIGCPIWGKKEWVGLVYPPKTSPKDYLKFYSSQFSTIEMNTTFYRIPDSATVEHWRSSAPSEFRFCPKVFQEISQFEVLDRIPSLTQSFCDAVKGFDKQLGVCFLQLPPSFGPQKSLILKRFFKLLPAGFRLAVEFRHSGWFYQNQLIDLAFDLLAESGTGTVITDVAGRRDVLHGSLSASFVLVRFVGNGLHPTDWTRLNQWIELLGRWISLGVQVYFFVHGPDEVGVLEMIQKLTQELNDRYGLSLRSWVPYQAGPPLQGELFG